MSPENQALGRLDIIRLERDDAGDYSRLVRCLRDAAVFPFDFATFVALAAETCDASLDLDAEA